MDIYSSWPSIISKVKFENLILYSEREFNALRYQLKTLILFVKYGNIINSNHDDSFGIFSTLCSDLVENFEILIKVYESKTGTQQSEALYRLMKAVISFLITCINRLSIFLKMNMLNFQKMLEVSFSHRTFHDKTSQLTLYFFNLFRIILNEIKNDTTHSDFSLFNIQFIDSLRLRYLMESIEKMELKFAEPECLLETVPQKDDSLIDYDIDRTIEEVCIALLCGISQINLPSLMYMSQAYLNKLSALNPLEIDSVVRLFGFMTKSVYTVSSNTDHFCPAMFNACNVVEAVNTVMVDKNEQWKSFIMRRCIWLLGIWIVDDVNIELVSLDRIFTAGQWCVRTASSSNDMSLKIAAVLFVEHVVSKLESVPINENSAKSIEDSFLNPAIMLISSVLNEAVNCDSYTRVTEILIKLLQTVNLWDNVDLVKSCAQSIYHLWSKIGKSNRDTLILLDDLLKCLIIIMDSCNPDLIQALIGSLTSFVRDAVHIICGGHNSRLTSDARAEPALLMTNCLTLWLAIVKRATSNIAELETVYFTVLNSPQQFSNLSSEELSNMLEIMQTQFILKVMAGMTHDNYCHFTELTWTFVQTLSWSPNHEEDLCIMRIQLADLFLLGYHQLFSRSPTTLLKVNSFSSFLVDRTVELFKTTQPEPSHDPHTCLTSSTLTVLARLSLFDSSVMLELCQFLSTGKEAGQTQSHMAFGLLDRWLLRIDNQASVTLQQLFLLAGLQWLLTCYSLDCAGAVVKLDMLINCSIQVCSSVPDPQAVEQEKELIGRLTQPADRHLRLVYLYWNPMSAQHCPNVSRIVTDCLGRVHDCFGDKFQTVFESLQPAVKTEFLNLCATGSSASAE